MTLVMHITLLLLPPPPPHAHTLAMCIMPLLLLSCRLVQHSSSFCHHCCVIVPTPFSIIAITVVDMVVVTICVTPCVCRAFMHMKGVGGCTSSSSSFMVVEPLGKVMGMGTHHGLWVWVQVGVGVGTGFGYPHPYPYIERTYIKVGVAAVDLGDRRAVVTSVDVQATKLE